MSLQFFIYQMSLRNRRTTQGSVELTFIIDRTSSSLLISICRASKNFLKVEHVITWVLEVSIPAQLASILDAAIALKIFFCAH